MEYRQVGGVYRSGKNDLKKEFFEPCFQECVSYKRAVGFFTSTSLRSWASAFSRAFEGGFEMKLLIGPTLTPEDLEVIREARHSDRVTSLQEIADEFLLRALRFTQGDDQERLWLFRKMLESGRLVLKFAFTDNEDGIYHEKIGYFTFPNGDWIACDGSVNESNRAFTQNYERMQVFRSWIEADVERGSAIIEDFELAWRGEAKGLEVVSPSPSVLEKVGTYPSSNSELGRTRSKERDSKWQHQERAVEQFLKEGAGVLEMATGTGKTKTALKILKRLIEDDEVDSVVISMTGTDLLSQWYRELIEWTKSENITWPVLRQDQQDAHLERFKVINPPKILLISRAMLPRLWPEVSKGTLNRSVIIQDEVHGLGSPDNRKKLAGFHNAFNYVLGLSATPEREYDEIGSDFIEAEVGPVVFEFGIEDAIRKGILTELDYIPLPYSLTPEEKKLVQKYFGYKTIENGGDYSQEDIWRLVSSVYKGAERKLDSFKEFLDKDPEVLKRAIIFVSDTSYGERLMKLLHQYTHNYKGYFSGETYKYLEDFAANRISTLVTCHRVSQGIDIKDVSTVILFSSDRARLETIQRIGRCLRIDPNNIAKRAKVIDFIYESEDEPDKVREADEERKEWLSNIAKVKHDG